MLLARIASRIFGSGMPRSRMPLRIDDHVVLLDEAADAGDLGDALRLGEAKRRFQSWSERSSARFSSFDITRVLVDPADAGGVRAEGRRHAGRQPRAPRALRYSSTRERAQ